MTEMNSEAGADDIRNRELEQEAQEIFAGDDKWKKTLFFETEEEYAHSGLLWLLGLIGACLCCIISPF